MVTHVICFHFAISVYQALSQPIKSLGTRLVGDNLFHISQLHPSVKSNNYLTFPSLALFFPLTEHFLSLAPLE